MDKHFEQRTDETRDDWKTPKALYDNLDQEFHFDFDPCPTNPTFDGLKIDWGKSNYANPPYGREIIKWMEKGYYEFLKGKNVIFLIASRTDTQWWHQYVMRANEVRLMEGRLKFDDGTSAGTFGSAIAIFNDRRYNGYPRFVTCDRLGNPKPYDYEFDKNILDMFGNMRVIRGAEGDLLTIKGVEE